MAIKTIRLICAFLLFLLPVCLSAQTPEGSWSQTSSKQFLTEDGIKSYGRSFLETDSKSFGTVTYSFLADHSCKISSKSVHNPEARIFTGTWSVQGNQLTLTSNKISVISKFTIDKDHLIMDTPYPNSAITTNVVTTFKKM